MSAPMKIWKEPFECFKLEKHKDKRGVLFEILRFEDYNIPSNGQLYAFTINSGQRRGDHYHKEKQEWFTCVHGEAIVLITSMDGRNESIKISSSDPAVVYIAPMSSHALVNKSNKKSIIISYGSKQHSDKDEDTYFKKTFENYI